MPMDEHRAANRANWDARVPIHIASDEYGFHKYAADLTHLSSVVRFDKDKMPNLAGKRLVHLQCHIGTDTVSLARLGADVTGVDFSENAIEAAKELSRSGGTPVDFVVSELYDSRKNLEGLFDVVYTGVGAINWLSDIRKWAEVVSSLLKPGGFLFIREGHPIGWTLDESDSEKLVIRYPYFETEFPNAWTEDTTYVGSGTLDAPQSFDWNHGMAEILQAVIDAGMSIDRVEEYDFCEWKMTEQMVLGDDGLWRLPEGHNRVPLMWSLLATKSA